MEPLRSRFEKIAHKVAKPKYYEKFKLNRNLWKISFKMMYNVYVTSSVLKWTVGAALNHFPLLFCKSV